MENQNQPQLPTDQSIEQPTVPLSIPQKSKLPLFILIAFIFLILIGGGGYIIKSSNLKNQISNPQLNSQNLTPTQTTIISPTIDPTANWKTYTSSDFTFKYPSDWNFQIQKGATSILKTGVQQTQILLGKPSYKDETGRTLTVPVIPPTVVLTTATYATSTASNLKNYVNDLNAYNTPPKWSEIKINEITAQKVVHLLCQSGQCEDILITKGNMIIDFSDENNGVYIDQILSTFRFTNQQSEDQAIPIKVKDYALKNGYTQPIITTDFIKENQARGNIGDKGIAGGAKWFSAKINGEWVVVYIGNGLPKCSEVSQYQLPQNFLQCF
ncbi:MAG: hypothetical protein Q7K55_04225 [Candidatus Levybacteria bacterium]|nr:hypothetical protein [Candidatus Levybacteria bacterium]